MSPVCVCVSLAMLAGLSVSQSLGGEEGHTEDAFQAEVGHPWFTKEFVAILGNYIYIFLTFILCYRGCCLFLGWCVGGGGGVYGGGHG